MECLQKDIVQDYMVRIKHKFNIWQRSKAIEVITAKSFRTYKPQIKIYRERMHTGLSNSLRFANIIITNLNLYTVLVSSSKLMLS